MICKILSLVLLITLNSKGLTQIINTIAGTPGIHGSSGNNGPAKDALFASPLGIGTDKNGNIYVGDWFNWNIRKINRNGIVSVFAGTGIGGYSGDGGHALNAQFNVVYDIDVDKLGNVYLIDYGNSRVRKINTGGIIATVAGNGLPGDPLVNGVGDGGPATQAPLYSPLAMTIDENGNIYVVESSKNMIRKINNAGIISTIAGQGFLHAGYSGDGGPALNAKLHLPVDIAVDKNGNLFIAELGNHIIRKIDVNGIISTFAGTGVPGYSGDGGRATSAQLYRPFGVAVDTAGNVYIAEDSNHVIRKVDPGGTISTIAGTGVKGYSGDGGPSRQAILTIPQRLAVDDSSHIYLTDWVNHTVRKISSCVSTVVSSVSISASEVSVCEATPVTFTALPVNGGNNPFFQWKVNGINAGLNQNIFTATTLKDGDWVSCVMTSSLSCTAPVGSDSIRITIKPLPVANLPEEIIIEPGTGTGTQLNPLVTGNIISYEWTPPNGLSNPDIRAPIATPSGTTTYSLKIISSDSCEAKAKTTVVVYKKLRMPSAFTPNNDGLNDIFRIPAGTTLLLKEFRIFDRWGNTVFRSKDIHKGWDGRNRNIPLSAGVYVYLIEGKDPYGSITEKGTVLLIR